MIYTVGYSVSLASLTVAVLILAYFRWAGRGMGRGSVGRGRGRGQGHGWVGPKNWASLPVPVPPACRYLRVRVTQWIRTDSQRHGLKGPLAPTGLPLGWHLRLTLGWQAAPGILSPWRQLVMSGDRPGMLLSILQCPGWPSTAKGHPYP